MLDAEEEWVVFSVKDACYCEGRADWDAWGERNYARWNKEGDVKLLAQGLTETQAKQMVKLTQED